MKIPRAGPGCYQASHGGETKDATQSIVATGGLAFNAHSCLLFHFFSNPTQHCLCLARPADKSGALSEKKPCGGAGVRLRSWPFSVSWWMTCAAHTPALQSLMFPWPTPLRNADPWGVRTREAIGPAQHQQAATVSTAIVGRLASRLDGTAGFHASNARGEYCLCPLPFAKSLQARCNCW